MNLPVLHDVAPVQPSVRTSESQGAAIGAGIVSKTGHHVCRRMVRRRTFLQGGLGLLAVGFGSGTRLYAGRKPAITGLRSIDGDDSHQPDWEHGLTVTVGSTTMGASKADLRGDSDKVIQAAADYVGRLGGGTVKILPGTYLFRNAVHLPSRVRLLGCGAETVFLKAPAKSVELAADSDWYDQEITLTDATGFQVGDGVVLRAKNPHNGGRTVIKRTLVAKSGNRFKLDDGLRENLWLQGKPTCSSLFPLLTSERHADITIENLTLDGDLAANENLNGNYAGCIFFQDCNRCTMRNVEARNYNGDGISFQVCHDVIVEDCFCHDNANLGVHPGSGSQRPVIRNNRLARNSIGIFWCWGVRFGLAEGNRIDANRDFGISIGHRDTDNVMRDNQITNSGKVGVLFRPPSGGQHFWPNRNVLEHNRIVNSGGDDGIGIDIKGEARDLRIAGNQLAEKRGPAKRIGIRIGPKVGAVTLADNRVEGFSVDLLDQRQRSAQQSKKEDAMKTSS